METIGRIIANARKAHHLWMKDLLIEQDRCKPLLGLIPQFATVLDIPKDVLYAALGLLPDIRTLLSEATYHQVLHAFHVMRKILSALMKTCQVAWNPVDTHGRYPAVPSSSVSSGNRLEIAVRFPEGVTPQLARRRSL